jgi:hypothetical protein
MTKWLCQQDGQYFEAVSDGHLGVDQEFYDDFVSLRAIIPQY